MKKNIDLHSLPGFEKKCILLTGATDGIGLETARQLAKTPCKLILHGRNPEKMAQVLQKLKGAHPHARISSILADFESFDQVRQMAAQIREEYPDFNVLINNAGMMAKKRKLCEEGFDSTITVNYLSPFILTVSLLPLLLSQPESQITSLTSIGHRFFYARSSDLFGDKARKPIALYCKSKLLVIAFIRQLGSLLKETAVGVNCVHPGVILGTKISGAGIFKPFGSTRAEGAQTILNAAFNPALSGQKGIYLERLTPSTPSKYALDPAITQEIWKESFCRCGIEQNSIEAYISAFATRECDYH
ncbi:MAG: SDR family NAD(P)-dependent oxidoreductase [Anaerolineaceae bacterium]|nr:SDR family NAD(P)-dependent oxidoreductase [Anaerolineaceae bacterium]